ncbi:MAG: hypothetical protein ACRENA_10150 [Vulcanimicrobiaceae bacterium]
MKRPRTSLFLFISGIVLIASIFVGERMGEHVLRRTTETTAVVPEAATPTPQATVGESGPIVDWHRLQVVTVATDPGFPDPRVTKPTPTPTPKPSPTPPPPTPATPTPPPAGSPTPSPAASGSTQGIPSYAVPTPPGFQPPPGGGG